MIIKNTFIAIGFKVNAFGQKKKLLKPNFYEYLKSKSRNRHLVIREVRISCSYAFLGTCEAILRGKEMFFFCVEPHICIYISRI